MQTVGHGKEEDTVGTQTGVGGRGCGGGGSGRMGEIFLGRQQLRAPRTKCSSHSGVGSGHTALDK